MLFNRLLAYRPLDRLERMTDTDRADLLREVLREGPSENTWRSVVELFAMWPDGEAKLDALAWADRALASWDDRLRAADTASTALFDGPRLSSLARIVRSISIHRRAEGGRSELLAVIGSGEAGRLARLDIVRSEIGSDAWEAMADSPHLTGLQHLHVTNTVMGAEVLRRILASPRLPALRCLKLSDVAIEPQGLHTAVEASPAFELRAFGLSRNVLGDEGAGLLARASWLRSVERLILRHDFIRAPGMRALLSSAHLRPGSWVDLRDNAASESERTSLRRMAGDRGLQVLV